MLHRIEIPHPVERAADGLMLGNGDLSLSCYQKPGKIVFQFGKNDFWDRSLDLSEDPKPAHIRELREAILRHSVKVDGTTGKPETKELPPRLTEICRSMPSQKSAAPCPKPGPTLYIHYPPDWNGLRIRQTLEIENALLRVECRNSDGAAFRLEALVHPECNRFLIRWHLDGWTGENRYGGEFTGLPGLPPVCATLFREKELSPEAFAELEYREHGNAYFRTMTRKNPPPDPVLKDAVLIQELSDGECLFTAAARHPDVRSAEFADILRLHPSADACEGFFSFGVSTVSPEDARAVAEAGTWEKDREETRSAAERFWNRSAVSIPDSILEECWYAALHAKRCVLKRGVVPPGLFFPSTLRDYSLWHGDYHLNYNYQSQFLGDFETNHTETGDACFDGLRGLMALGEKISQDYYGIEGGCFIQLCGYPLYAGDDYFGYLPLGRMAYMTGWTAACFHRRWKWTMDRTFLRSACYPALKKFAVFYEGFLEKGDDGFYHAFPSNQGENDFSASSAYDQTQVLQHACFALLAAAEAAEALQTDLPRARSWREIASQLPRCEEICRNMTAPEFRTFDGIAPDPGRPPEFLTPGTRFHDWYAGQVPYRLCIYLRQGLWKAAQWNGRLIALLKRWLQPNGLLRAMSIATHGFQPGWTESLGLAGAITDMLMTSDGGLIRLFPGLPPETPCAFHTLRAQGAFLVSARRDTGGHVALSVFSEAGGTCRIENPGTAFSCISSGDRKEIILSGPVLCFETEKAVEYTLTPQNGSEQPWNKNPSAFP